MDADSRLKATCSFASEATVAHKGSGVLAPSPLSQKPLYPPSYNGDDNTNTMSTEKHQPLERSKRIKSKMTRIKSLLLKLLKKYWFLLGLAFVISLAYAAPNVARKGGYIHAEWSIKWGAVIIIFLISGLSLRTRILTQTFMRVRLHLLVQLINLVIIPFFVFGLVLLLFKLHVPMNSLVLMGVVIAASTPTTVSSNVVMTKAAKGNEATALMNAALGNVLGIFISPALVDTFQEPLIDATPENESAEAGGKVDFVRVLKQLGITVLIPLVVGQIIQIMFTEKVAKIKVKWRLSDVSSVCLLTMVWSVFCDAFYSGSFNSVAATDIVGVVIMNIGFYLLFSLLALFLAHIPLPSSIREPSWVSRLRYNREDTVAVMFCGATKTVAMGVPLINVLYQNGDPGTIGVLSTPLLLYHVEQLILGNIEVDILKRWVLHGQQQQQQQQEEDVPSSPTKDMMPPHRDLEDQSFVHHHPPAPPPPVIIQPPYGKHQQQCGKGSSPPVSPAETVQANVGYLNQQHPLFDKHASSSTMEASSLVGEDDMDKEHKDLQSNLSATRIEKTAADDDEDIFSSPFFTADTASISLDTSRFSTDTLATAYHNHRFSEPVTVPQHPPPKSQRRSWYR